MGKALVCLFLLVMSGVVQAQTPRAKFEYVGSGCGWFAGARDLRVTFPPVVGNRVQFATSIPPFGVDTFWFGSLDPKFPIYQVSPTGCKIRAFSFPQPITVWIPWTATQRWNIPNDPGLVGYTLYAQQMNMSWGPTPTPIWHVSRGVKLTLGF